MFRILNKKFINNIITCSDKEYNSRSGNTEISGPESLSRFPYCTHNLLFIG